MKAGIESNQGSGHVEFVPPSQKEDIQRHEMKTYQRNEKYSNSPTSNNEDLS